MCPDSLGEIRNRGGRSERHIEIKARRRRTKFCVRTAVLRGAVGTFSTQHDGADPISTNVPPDDPSVTVCHIRNDGRTLAACVSAAVFSDWRTDYVCVLGRYIGLNHGCVSSTVDGQVG